MVADNGNTGRPEELIPNYLVQLQKLVGIIAAEDFAKLDKAIRENKKNWRAHASPDAVNRTLSVAILAELSLIRASIDSLSLLMDPTKQKIIVP